MKIREHKMAEQTYCMWQHSFFVAGWLFSVILLSACSSGGGGFDCMNDIERPCIPLNEPHAVLSDYAIYKGDLGNLEPEDGLLPYDLNTQLFSDYAQKLRLVYVPEGASASYKSEGVLKFPVGSVLVKNFFYRNDLRDLSADRRIIETRLLIHRENGWAAETYVWNEEQSEALLQQTGDIKDISWIDSAGILRKVNYLIPTKNDCKNCHSEGNALIPLGPEVRNLNKIYRYAEGEENQLAQWEATGILIEKPAAGEIPKVPVWDDSSTGTLNERARIYLDVNCANCHNPSGSARNSGLFLTFTEQDSFRLGICKPPVAAGPGSGGLDYNIVPGQPDSSILIFRMESVEPEERMPEIGRTLVHEEAVKLIKEWIASLDCPACE